MFTNERRQEELIGKYGTPRLQYLQELVTQFQNASDEELKEKIVANLANFAYDPFNYTYLRQIQLMQQLLLNVGGSLLSSNVYQALKNTVNYALAALYYICNESNKEEILKPEVVDAVKRYATSGASSWSFSNLAQAFLDKHVSELN